MTQYFEYGVKLSDNQKRNLASAMNSKSPLTLRLKHGNLTGNDELMLTKTQLKRIQKSLNNGTGADIKISKTQIRKVAKQGGSLFSTLASLGARVLINLCCKRFDKSCTRLFKCLSSTIWRKISYVSTTILW